MALLERNRGRAGGGGGKRSFLRTSKLSYNSIELPSPLTKARLAALAADLMSTDESLFLLQSAPSMGPNPPSYWYIWQCGNLRTSSPISPLRLFVGG